MARTSATAQRFYTAFYRWASLTSHESPCVHSLLLSPSRRRLHATSYWADEPSGSQSTLRIHRVVTDQSSQPRRYQHAPKDTSGAAKEFNGTPPAHFRDAPVQTSSERPFDALEPWEEVIRYRSDSSIMLLFALPTSVLVRLQKKYGEALERVREVLGARAEASNRVSKTTKEGEKVDMISILASGTHEEVARFRHMIRSYAARQLAPRWMTMEPQTQLTQPAGNLKPWGAPVIRERHADGNAVVAWVVAIEEIEQIRAEGDLDKIKALTRLASITDSPVAAPADNEGVEQPPMLRSLTLCGRVPNINNFIVKMRARRMQLLSGKKRTNSLPSEPAVQIRIPEQESTSGGVWRLKLAIPKHPDPSKDLSRSVLGHDNSNLKTIMSFTGLNPMRSPAFSLGELLLIGRKSKIVRAKTLLQRNLRSVCERDGIEILNIIELEPLTRHEAADNGQNTRAGDASSEVQANDIKSETLGEDLKLMLRPLVHPVALVTSRMKDELEQHESTVDHHNAQLKLCRGVTVSSFNAVTIAPKPIISFNLRVPSRTWDAISSIENLCVHLLYASARGAAVAHAFTQPYEDPSEPFRKLQEQGASIVLDEGPQKATFKPGKLNSKPPAVVMPGAVMGRMAAHPLKDKCVTVGDHVVVVAQVRRVWFDSSLDMEQSKQNMESATGLAYARRGYRDIGREIKPVELSALAGTARAENENANDTGYEMQGTEDVDADADATVPPAEDKSGAVRDEAQRSADDMDFDYFRAAAENTESKESEAVSEQQHRQRIIDDEEAEYDLGFDPEGGETVLGQDRDAKRDGLPERSTEQAQTSQSDSPTTSLRSTSANPASHAQTRSNRTGPRHGSKHACGVTPPLQSSFSTLTCAHRRYHSTVVPHAAASTHSRQDVSTQNSSNPPTSQVTHPELLASTVGDFLGIADEPGPPPPRTRALLRTKMSAERASRRLERALADGTLTPEESEHLELVIARSERTIAKRLAFQSAHDLRSMLDKGRVDVRRVQWLESSVEKGQAIFLEEAKQLRSMLDGGSIGEERFKLVKEKLQRHHQILNVELLRLRQMFDEEGEGGGAGYEQEAPQRERRFDGFRGNL